MIKAFSRGDRESGSPRFFLFPFAPFWSIVSRKKKEAFVL